MCNERWHPYFAHRNTLACPHVGFVTDTFDKTPHSLRASALNPLPTPPCCAPPRAPRFAGEFAIVTDTFDATVYTPTLFAGSRPVSSSRTCQSITYDYTAQFGPYPSSVCGLTAKVGGA